MTLDRAHVEELYRRHAPSAFRRARRMLGNDADAHEVVHDVFVLLCERPDQYRGQSSLSTFFYSVVTNACLNRLRNQNNRQRLLRLQQMTSHPPVWSATQAEDQAQLRALLARLPENLAQVAIYYHWDGLTHRDIARVMGCSSSHVGDLLERLTQWTQRQESATCPS